MVTYASIIIHHTLPLSSRAKNVNILLHITLSLYSSKQNSSTKDLEQNFTSESWEIKMLMPCLESCWGILSLHGRCFTKIAHGHKPVRHPHLHLYFCTPCVKLTRAIKSLKVLINFHQYTLHYYSKIINHYSLSVVATRKYCENDKSAHSRISFAKKKWYSQNQDHRQP